ncbi:HesA/MoeB/ThiF family protein [Hydrotalea sp.]|uniref:HesA/MoeB/ThiF family protein n=1 Tax=Hydrotalea sp. TaxID=2881279 RepID=UPI00262BC651|nr:HesA/MoeB/ThiF family protein [Hydrotalea sp.]
MLTTQEQIRYQRHLILPEIGVEGQLKLKAAKVLIIGAGGLGCPLLQYLTAAGVGHITIMDGDIVEESNLQRQILYAPSNVGLSKAIVASQKAKAINPLVNVTHINAFITPGNALSVIEQYDIVVDGSDNFTARYLVNDACVIKNKPLVFGSIYKFEGQVSVFNFQNGPTYRCIFPEPPGDDDMPNCAEIGVVATLPGIVGTILANEVVKIITGQKGILSGKLLVIDVTSMHFQVYHFQANPLNKTITALHSKPTHAAEKNYYIDLNTLLELLAYKELQLIDVREADEHHEKNIGGLNIPLNKLEDSYKNLNPASLTVVYCAAGQRSKKAAQFLLGKGFKEIYSLEKGINGYNI